MVNRKSLIIVGVAVAVTVGVFLIIRSNRLSKAESGSVQAKVESQFRMAKELESGTFTTNSPQSLLGSLDQISQITNITEVERALYVKMLSQVIETYSDGSFSKYLEFKNSFGPAEINMPRGNTITTSSVDELQREWEAKSQLFIKMTATQPEPLPKDFKIRITEFDPKSLILEYRQTVVVNSGLDRILNGRQITGIAKIENRYFEYNRGPEHVLESEGKVKWLNVAFSCYSSLAKVPGYIAVSAYFDESRNKWIPYEMISCSPPTLFLMF